MTANLALDLHAPDLTARDLRELTRQLDLHQIPNETPVGLRKVTGGERLVVVVREMRRTPIATEKPVRRRNGKKTTTATPAP